MSIEVVHDSPLAKALQETVLAKLVEVGWASASDPELAEFIVLMLVNGKDQERVVSELSGDLLGLASDDATAQQFVAWLFDQIPIINAQLTGNSLPPSSNDGAPTSDHDMDMNVSSDAPELNAPTGPRSMRNGNNNPRGGRERRMLGHMSKAMDRSADSTLHRVRGQTGNERINTHSRGTPTGPRGNQPQGRFPRNNNRAASIQAGMAAMQGMNPPAGPGAMNGMNANWMMPGNQMDLYAILEQQQRMMAQLSQQIGMAGGANNNNNNNNNNMNNGGHPGNQRHGKPLFERVQQPGRGGFRRGGGHHQHGERSERPENNAEPPAAAAAEGEDVDMSAQEKREPTNPEDMVCKFNLRCTKQDCKFAHQSPAAPPGTHVDVHDVCSFGAACKNHKCVARHPSPATRLAHQSQQDCKFFPNCQNPHCPFRHPTMPLCRNGADCTTPGCKFTHVKTKCRYNPCKNPNCAFAHDEGQQGGYKDRVWTAEGGDHVSERKFIVDGAGEETVLPDAEGGEQGGDAAAAMAAAQQQEQSGLQAVMG